MLEAPPIRLLQNYTCARKKNYSVERSLVDPEMFEFVNRWKFSIVELRQLIEDTRSSQLRAFAEGTIDNLLVQWVKFLLFCTHFGLKSMPVSTTVLTWYVQYLSRSLKSHRSVVNYLSGVKMLHVLMDQSIDGFVGFSLKLTLRGLRRLNSHVPHQAYPMSPQILCNIKQCLDLTNPEDIMFWAICLMAFFLLFRKSNLVPDKLSDLDKSKLLCRRDLIWLQQSILVSIRWAKTNQFGEVMTYPLPKIPGSELCPYSAMQAIFECLPADADSLCFIRSDGRPFTYYQFQTKLRKALTLAGYEAWAFSSHSFRRGGTTFCFLAGVPTELIRALGGWRSDCYLAYLQFPIEARSAATELMKLRIQAVGW